MDGEKPTSIHDMVLKNVEKPMIELVLSQSKGNQTLAAEMLGINRQYAAQEDEAAADQRVVSKVARALVSVSDKSGIVELARSARGARHRDPLHRRAPRSSSEKERRRR